MVAIVALTGSSTVLFGGLTVALIHVVVRRESANIAVKQIQTLVQASRSIASAALDNVDSCAGERVSQGELKPLLAYTREEFPGARIAFRMVDSRDTQLLPSQTNASAVEKPSWLPPTGFAGLVADNGRIEIRNFAERKLSGCTVTAVFEMPLGPEVARRISTAADIDIRPVQPRVFRVHRPTQQIVQTIKGNFIPGAGEPAAVVLTVRNWKTGAREDWIAYMVQSDLSRTFGDIEMLGSQRANWV